MVVTASLFAQLTCFASHSSLVLLALGVATADSVSQIIKKFVKKDEIYRELCSLVAEHRKSKIFKIDFNSFFVR